MTASFGDGDMRKVRARWQPSNRAVGRVATGGDTRARAPDRRSLSDSGRIVPAFVESVKYRTLDMKRPCCEDDR